MPLLRMCAVYWRLGMGRELCDLFALGRRLKY